MIDPIHWDESASVHQPEIDAQHKTVISQIGLIEDALYIKKAQSFVRQAVDYLEGYAVEHFSFEESFFKSKNYPKAESHSGQHALFIDHVKQIRDRLDREGPSQSLAVDIHIFLSEWFKTHIRIFDKDYDDFVRTGRCAGI